QIQQGQRLRAEIHAAGIVREFSQVRAIGRDIVQVVIGGESPVHSSNTLCSEKVKEAGVEGIIDYRRVTTITFTVALRCADIISGKCSEGIADGQRAQGVANNRDLVGINIARRVSAIEGETKGGLTGQRQSHHPGKLFQKTQHTKIHSVNSSRVGSEIHTAALAGSGEKPEAHVSFFKQHALELQSVAGGRVIDRAFEKPGRGSQGNFQRITTVVDDFVVH